MRLRPSAKWSELLRGRGNGLLPRAPPPSSRHGGSAFASIQTPLDRFPVTIPIAFSGIHLRDPEFSKSATSPTEDGYRRFTRTGQRDASSVWIAWSLSRIWSRTMKGFQTTVLRLRIAGRPVR